MAWAVSDVRAIAPEFTSVPDDTITSLISDADLQLSPTAWASARDPQSGRTVRDIAGTWLTAHLLALTRPDLARMPVTSKRVGAVGVTYANGSATSAVVLRMTRFGTEYLRLVNSQIGAGLDVL